MRPLSSYLKSSALIIAALLILGYAGFQSRNLVRGPVVTIQYPKNGALVSDALIEITGTTQNIAAISLNDYPIFIDETGAFREELLLSYGYNILAVRAADRFGRETETILEIVYQH